MSLAARIVTEAAGADVAAAGCRVAVAQLRADLNNPDLTATQRRRRFDEVAAATKNLLARTPKENRMTDWTDTAEVNQKIEDAQADLTSHRVDAIAGILQVTGRYGSDASDVAADVLAAIAVLGWKVELP